ncbi:MAG: ribbon-helix-helix protein, CopG family [Candidatus Lokiarchaeota archaeon]|nr:ribbon-helix-helix protein, CopG family [Candidatus Lokiarchaeota archaeon]
MVLRKRGYRQVSLPIPLIERVDEIINKRIEMGYTSVPEFIRTAIREKLEKIED